MKLEFNTAVAIEVELKAPSNFTRMVCSFRRKVSVVTIVTGRFTVGFSKGTRMFTPIFHKISVLAFSRMTGRGLGSCVLPGVDHAYHCNWLYAIESLRVFPLLVLRLPDLIACDFMNISIWTS